MIVRKHPVAVLLNELNLTAAEFALLVGVDSSEVSQVLRGARNRLPRRWRPVLEALNIDYDEFNREYTAWRVHHREQVLQELQHRRGEHAGQATE